MDSKVKIRNFTPHMINIYQGHACIAGYPSEGNVRVATSEERVPCEGLPCPVFVRQGTTVHGLPEPENGTLIVVSSMVRAACPDRLDLISPGSGRESLVRDPSGAVSGCRDFDAQPAVLKICAKVPPNPACLAPSAAPASETDAGVVTTDAPIVPAEAPVVPDDAPVAVAEPQPA